jgi:hypothetical protein
VRAEREAAADGHAAIRREADAGNVAMTALAAKMGNSIDTSKALQKPTCRSISRPCARPTKHAGRGRRLLGEERNKHRKLKLGGE